MARVHVERVGCLFARLVLLPLSSFFFCLSISSSSAARGSLTVSNVGHRK